MYVCVCVLNVLQYTSCICMLNFKNSFGRHFWRSSSGNSTDAFLFLAIRGGCSAIQSVLLILSLWIYNFIRFADGRHFLQNLCAYFSNIVLLEHAVGLFRSIRITHEWAVWAQINWICIEGYAKSAGSTDINNNESNSNIIINEHRW